MQEPENGNQPSELGRAPRDLFERAPVGIHIQAADGTLERVNRAFLEILGFGHDECTGRNWAEFHLEPHAAHNVIDRIARGEAVRDCEVSLRARDGTPRFALISADLLGPSGSPVRARLFSRDITPLKQAQLAVQEADRRKAAILNASLDAIITMDAQGRLVDFNNAAESIFGYSRHEAVGRQLAQLIIPPALRDEHAEGLRRYLATGQARLIGRRVEVMALHASGREFPVELSIAPVEAAVPLFTATLRDISHRRAAFQAQQEAERNKDAFIAALAHELRNPLAPMRNAAALLQVPELPPERQQWAVGVMLRQISHMARLLDDLLDAARISHGKLALQVRWVVLQAVVQSSVEIVQTLIDERQQVLKLELPLEEIRLQADPIRLSQVLSNLLVNASKYSPQGAVIELRANVVDDHLQIDVVDHGMGLDSFQIGQLFTMFRQLSTQHGPSASGLGVGLALSKTLVEMHGGSIRATSAGPGHGSTFTVRMPMTAPEASR